MVKHTLLNKTGELSPHGVAVCVEKMLAGKMNELPTWMLNHIKQFPKCRSKITFLLEYEKENAIKQTIQTNICANTLTSYKKYETNNCNAALQVIEPMKNDVQIGEICFQFEHSLKSNAQLYIIDHTDKQILNVELKHGSSEYSFKPKYDKTGIYYYIIGTATTSVVNYFYYCTNEDKNRLMTEDLSCTSL